MALKVLLQDHWLSGPGVVRAATVYDEDDPVGDALEATRAPAVSYVPSTFDPVLDAFRAQRERLPGTSPPSLAEMLRAAGLM